MQHIALEDIVIERSQQDVFRVLTEPAFSARINPSISRVRAPSMLRSGVTFTRTFSSHGIPNWQTVHVEASEAPHTLTLTTRLLLMRVRYAYRLHALGAQTTRVRLQKEADTRAPWGALLVHLLTAPEHEGAHLTCLREVAESLPA